MPLTPGTRLGPYEIAAPLGAGGMGEVFRAKDTRLGRDVAIKVLPQHLSANAEVRARFEREAKTVSSLNHPHICTLHDVGREGDTDYLVMELVDGETLAARLGRGALPPTEVLRLGAQIADALDRAHRAGVIHRDLKPGNVMLTKSGAKLMDFGLARATGMAGPAGASGLTAALTQSPTVAQPLTAEGSIVGTFQYMAPEQLEGKEADARSDIWALGCVLYEMATGRRAFEGRSQASLITAIMGTEPPSVSQVSPAAPPGLDRLVRTCLTKDPDERVQTAHDVKLQLQGIGEGGSQAGASSPALPARRSPARLAWAVAAGASLVALTLVAVLISRSLAPRLPIQLSITAPEHTRIMEFAAAPKIAPDGRAVSFTTADSGGGSSAWLQMLDAAEPTRLVRSKANVWTFWSPDGRTLGLLDVGAGELRTLAIGGGTPVSLCSATNPRGAAWSPDGVIVFSPTTQGPLQRIPATGGEPTDATTLDTTRHEMAHRFPCFLPDGKHFLYVSLPPGPEGFEVFVTSLGSRVAKRIMTAESAPVYAEPGYLLFRRAGKIVAQRFDRRGLELQGGAIPVADSPPLSQHDSEPVASASKTGRLVHLVGQYPETELKWYDRSGLPLNTLSLPVGRWGQPILSPDNRFAAVFKDGDLWRIDLARSVAARLTSSGDLVSFRAAWSPDGRRLAYARGLRGRDDIHVMNSDGSGEERLLPTTDELFKAPEGWTRAGLVFWMQAAATLRDLWILPDSLGAKPAPFLRTRFAESGSVVSPDGKWIAYLSNEAGFLDVYLQSFPVAGHKVRVTSEGVVAVWWMPGSNELCYRSQNGLAFKTVKLTHLGDDLEVGVPRLLFQPPADVLTADFTKDGQRVLVNATSRGSQDRRFRVVLDWTGLLKR